MNAWLSVSLVVAFLVAWCSIEVLEGEIRSEISGNFWIGPGEMEVWIHESSARERDGCSTEGVFDDPCIWYDGSRSRPR